MGLYKNGRPDINAIKAFQQKNGLKADGIIGADTSGAILSAAPAGMTGSSRGGQGGAAAYKVDSQLPVKPVQNPTPAAGPPPGSGTIMPGVKDSEGRQVYKRPDSSEMSWDSTTQRFFPYSGQSMIDRVRTSVGIPAGGTSPGIKESQEIQRMKFLAGLNK
jgi:peptidoglycan hydrolase-like protein with peptidoglycan-binding domain